MNASWLHVIGALRRERVLSTLSAKYGRDQLHGVVPVHVRGHEHGSDHVDVIGAA